MALSAAILTTSLYVIKPRADTLPVEMSLLAVIVDHVWGHWNANGTDSWA